MSYPRKEQKTPYSSASYPSILLIETLSERTPMKQILFFLSVTSLWATPQQEIQHLLDFVKNTSCQYERNGDKHTGQEAQEHIQKKYRYYMDDVQTAEDFIRLSATQSTMSGTKYKIHCAGKAVQYSKDWLLAELQIFRSKH